MNNAFQLFRDKLTSLEQFIADSGAMLIIVHDDDSPEYKEFLSKLHVMKNEWMPGARKDLPRDVSFEARSSQCELVDRVIERLVLNEASMGKHVLSLGYRLARPDSVQVAGRRVENYSPNMTVNFIKSGFWDTLLQRIGDTVMEYLLVFMLVFYELPRGCFMQVAGSLLNELLSRYPKVFGASNNPMKKQWNFKFGGSVFDPHKIFLSRRGVELHAVGEALNSGFGLPPSHETVDENVKQVLKSIFTSWPEFFSESELHWRMAPIFPLIAKLMKKLKQIPIRTVLKDICSLQEPASNYSYNSVYLFLKIFIERVVPLGLFGTKTNLNLILKKIREYIELKQFEKMSLSYAMKGFKISDCSWTHTKATKKCGAEESKLRSLLVHHFVLWLWDSVVVVLIRRYFFITESTSHRNRLFYFRKDQWRKIEQHAYENIEAELFKPLSLSELSKITKQRNVGFTPLRLVPKEKGLRPIVNANKRYSILNKDRLLYASNYMLKSTFAVLNYERQRQKSHFGCSVAGLNEIYESFKNFKITIGQNYGKLYMAKVDLKSAFDRINQEELYKWVMQVLPEDEYLVQKFTTIQRSNNGSFKRINKNVACSSDRFPSLIGCFNDILEYAYDSIVLDLSSSVYISKDKILQDIADHILNILVQVNGKICRQQLGIPQGSVLSTLLCSLVYGKFEKESGLRMMTNNSLTMRFVDDYLHCSVEKENVIRFLSLMDDSGSGNKTLVNASKTRLNFSARDNTGKDYHTSEGEWFSWCGIEIAEKSFDMRIELSRYYGLHASDTCTVDRTLNVFKSILHKLKFYFKTRCHLVFIDTGLNSRETVIGNIYAMYLICAVKFAVFGNILKNVNRKHPGVYVLIKKFLYASIRIVRSCIASPIGVRMKAKFSLDEAELSWLCYKAFHKVINRKQTLFKGAVAALKKNATSLEPKLKQSELFIRAISSAYINAFLKQVIY